MNATIGSGYGVVPSDSKPLPEPVFNQFYVATRPQQLKLESK